MKAHAVAVAATPTAVYAFIQRHGLSLTAFRSLTSLTAFVSSCKILLLERTLSVQSSISSRPDGISSLRALTWLASRQCRKRLGVAGNYIQASTDQAGPSGGADLPTIDETDDDDNAIATRRSRAVDARWLILTERRSPAIFNLQLAGRCFAFYVFMSAFIFFYTDIYLLREIQ